MKLRLMGRRAKIGLALLVLLLFNLSFYVHVSAACVGPHMMLFWDPGSGYGTGTPTDWEFVTTFDGRFPRGESAANYGATGGGAADLSDRPLTPTVASVTVGGPNQTITGGGGGGGQATDVHTHPTTNIAMRIGADSNGSLPAYRSLKLMRYNPTAGICIPTTIPAGAIAMFPSTTLPTNVTRYAAQDARVTRVNSSVATGGNDSVTNTVCFTNTNPCTSSSTNIGASTTPGGNIFNLFPNTATSPAATHNHTLPGGGTTASTSALPPYVQPIFGQATQNLSTIALNITAMFDGDPGNGWSVQSNSGGPYYQQFLRPNATVNFTSQGALTHTDPTYIGTTGNATSGGAPTTLNLGAGQLATSAHNHNISVAFNSVSNVPPYFNVVIAQKVSFTLQHYRWYVDSDGEDLEPVNGPWPDGSLNTAIDSPVVAIPAPFRPPDINDQLRLRVQILVSGQNLIAGAVVFKLQYQATTTADCLSGTWVDVDPNGGPGTALWRYGDNGVTDVTPLSTSRLSPASSVLEVFSKSAGGAATINSATTGQTIEFDWLIQNFSADGATSYFFRPVENNGTPLGEYNGQNPSKCPNLITRPSTEQVMRHGNFFQDNVERGYEWAD